MLVTLNQVCWTFVRGNYVYTLQQEISEKWDPVFPSTWISHKVGQRSKFIILSFSFTIDKQEISCTTYVTTSFLQLYGLRITYDHWGIKLWLLLGLVGL